MSLLKTSQWIRLTSGGEMTAVVLPPAAPKAASINKYFNRDLSWLAFNDRVLDEADDPSVPALERLRFASIVSSNLDEFFAVRVAEIAQRARRYPQRRFPDGLTTAQALSMIREHVLRQKARQALVLNDILDTLEKTGIVLYRDFNVRGAVDREVRKRLPEIRFVLKNSSEPIPASLMSERLHVFVRFPGEYAILTIQDREGRLVELPASGGKKRFALAERWLSDRAQEFFPGREVIEAFPFKIIREADLRYRPEDEETLEEQIHEAVLRRQRAKVIRLEVDAPMYSDGALFLATSLGLNSASLYRFDLPLDLRTLARLYNLTAGAKLKYPAIKPQVPQPLVKNKTFDVIRRNDVLLHHPYDSFDVVVDFLEEAARDEKVTRIYHTMYRTSRESPIMEALKEAVRRGKKVTAYVEIKARFDELNNLKWAEELRQAGVRVVRPLGGFKVHSKVTQVFRKEEGEERSYLHLGTGNYHPTTALQYTDLGLFTADWSLGQEVGAYFSRLAQTKRAPAAKFKELLVAPQNLHQQLVRLIRAETKIQQDGGRGHIVGKMNALVDRETIDALYAASQAGVKVDLIVRGICCLRPGIKGLSENIRVVSVVDRFLEHSRIFYFRSGGADKVYLSSADWMPRNFYTRFELAFPVKDPALRRYIRDVILATGLADNVKAAQLKADGSYAKAAEMRKGAPELRSQFVFEALARNRYRETILEHRLPA
jgi:polyphosphate kinase